MNQRVENINPSDVAARPHRYYRRKYVWQWPIRIFHWVNAIAVAVLFGTGLYIAQPSMAPAGEAYGNNVMGTVRMIHFLFAFIFLVNFLWRVYWFFAGNNYARSGFPKVWRLDWWQDLFRQGWDYLKLQRGHVHLGHNALGGLTYTICVIFFGWFQIFSGLAMYSESDPTGMLGSLFGGVLVALGGSFQTHMWHHLIAWGFLVFTILHLYIVFYDGEQYKNGLVASIVSGVKFYRDGHLDHKDWLS